MAGILKARDAGGVLRAISVAKARDAGGVLRTLAFIRVRGPDNVLREVFTAGGGAPASQVSIAPPAQYISRKGASASAQFQAQWTGDAPTAFQWGVLDGPGRVTSPTAAATQLTVSCDPSDSETATFFCDMTIDGQVYRATCSFTYVNTLTA